MLLAISSVWHLALPWNNTTILKITEVTKLYTINDGTTLQLYVIPAMRSKSPRVLHIDIYIYILYAKRRAITRILRLEQRSMLLTQSIFLDSSISNVSRAHPEIYTRSYAYALRICTRVYTYLYMYARLYDVCMVFEKKRIP